MNELNNDINSDGYPPIVGQTARWARKMTAKRMSYFNKSVIEIACDGDHFARGIHDLKHKHLQTSVKTEGGAQ